MRTFAATREWRNGRRAGLRIRCRKAWGFKSPLSQSLTFTLLFRRLTGWHGKSFGWFDSQIDSHRKLDRGTHRPSIASNTSSAATSRISGSSTPPWPSRCAEWTPV